MSDFDKVFEVLDNKVPWELSKKRQLLLVFRDIERPSSLFTRANNLKACTEIIRELQTTGSTKALQNRNWNQKFVAAKLASLYVLFQETTRTRPASLEDAVLGAFQELSKVLVEHIPSERSTVTSALESENNKQKAARNSETQMTMCRNDAKRQRTNQTELLTISDDVLALIMLFCEPLQLRAMWFVCRRLRDFLLANDRLVWQKDASWAGAGWISRREICLLLYVPSQGLDFMPKACSGCRKVVCYYKLLN